MAAPAWHLDHVAVLVRSIEDSVALLSGLLGTGMPMANEIEGFEGEGRGYKKISDTPNMTDFGPQNFSLKAPHLCLCRHPVDSEKEKAAEAT